MAGLGCRGLDREQGVGAKRHSKPQTLNLIPVQEYEPGQQNKVSRAQDATRFFRAGRIRIPLSAPWVADWVAEHLRFPAGDNDDQVDTTSMAMAIFGGSVEAGSPLVAAPWETTRGWTRRKRSAPWQKRPRPGAVPPPKKTTYGRRPGRQGIRVVDDPHRRTRGRGPPGVWLGPTAWRSAAGQNTSWPPARSWRLASFPPSR